ncbi:Monocarboxylate transporter 9 [Daphnia magna]|uniref:Uncharacterized protein n=2 Tax=Daphnia magna TaxID=35525 RepID=A0ABR0AJ32_9CRUS|nr:hypothetical protein OUZ56_010626 [Daphnia magna]KZS21269.1 Monocarboxylate transporter 9 [Daphnia magna]
MRNLVKLGNSMANTEALRSRFVAPDGGYGWFVAFGAFLVQFWIAGLIKSYGVIFMEVMQLYPDASASLASWIPAILSTLCLVSSPICSALCRKFSCRAVVFTGGLLCWMGVSLSYFTTSLQQLCLTFGILTGLGAGLATTPGIIMTSRYFNKRRALANGLCVSGTAVGSMLLPPLLEVLVPAYGFRGSILILGACMLHICLSAALYRPIEIHQAIMESVMGMDIPTNLDGVHVGGIDREVHVPDGRPVTINEDDISLVHSNRNNVLSNNFPHRLSVIHSIEDLSTNSTVIYTENIPYPKPKSPDQCLTEKFVQTEPQNSPVKKLRRFKLCSITNYIDLSLIKNPLFLLMASTVMLMAVGCPHALFYLPSYANSLGLEKSQCSLLLSISAIFDLSGRLGLGYIADLNLFSKSKAYSVSMLTGAIAVLCLPFATTFASFAVIVSFYGFGLGSWFLLIPVLLSEHHGTESIGSSYGLVRLFQGVITLVVPPLVGYSKDATGDYVTGFYFMGISMMTGAILINFKSIVLRLGRPHQNSLP